MHALRNLSFVWLVHLLTVLVAVCFTAVSTGAQSKAFNRADIAVVNKFISGQMSELGGEEYEGARKIVTGDLDHDGVPEGAGGGNNYTQYLAVFLRLDGKLVPTTHTVVGGKGNRAVQLASTKDNVINLTTLSYGPHDAMCCPSIKGTAHFVVANGELVSQPSPPSPKLRQ